jgi:hypothetical protein
VYIFFCGEKKYEYFFIHRLMIMTFVKFPIPHFVVYYAWHRLTFVFQQKILYKAWVSGGRRKEIIINVCIHEIIKCEQILPVSSTYFSVEVNDRRKSSFVFNHHHQRHSYEIFNDCVQPSTKKEL